MVLGTRYLKLALEEAVVYCYQQPEVNYVPHFSPQLISLEYSTLRVQFSGEIDLLENLDIVHITLLVVGQERVAWRKGVVRRGND